MRIEPKYFVGLRFFIRPASTKCLLVPARLAASNFDRHCASRNRGRCCSSARRLSIDYTTPNNLYDHVVRHLFNGRLHRHDHYHVHFARRGTSSRTKALRSALESTREVFLGKRSDPPVLTVSDHFAYERAGLQAADYFLWSLQRLYEHREDRYLELVWPQCRLIRDMDDPAAATGTYYEQKRRRLTLAALNLEGRPGI